MLRRLSKSWMEPKLPASESVLRQATCLNFLNFRLELLGTTPQFPISPQCFDACCCFVRGLQGWRDEAQCTTERLKDRVLCVFLGDANGRFSRGAFAPAPRNFPQGLSKVQDQTGLQICDVETVLTEMAVRSRSRRSSL